MVERKPSNFKTRLCILYQRGRCPRETCTFAHGEAELRRFTNSLNDRRDHRHNDLRDKLDRKRSPVRRHSPGKYGRFRNSFRGNSPNRSLEKISDRKRRMEIDDRSDFSGSAKITDGTEDHLSGRKQSSSNTRSVHHEHLRQVQADISMLDEHKYELEVYLQDRTHEADCLNSRIKELEAQLSQENEECKRITSKMKKFLKAHDRHLHLQEELNRSLSRLQKLGEQLGSDSIRLGDNEDSNLITLSDGETLGNHTSSRDPLPRVASPRKKRPRINSRTTTGISKSDVEREVNPVEMFELEKWSRWDKNNVRAGGEDNGYKHGTRENRKKMEKVSFNVLASDKYKGGGGEQTGLPPTSMAAHAEDQVIENEMIDGEENVDVVGMGSVGAQIEAVARSSRRLPQNVNLQHKGEDQNVDVDGNEEELVDVDIV